MSSNLNIMTFACAYAHPDMNMNEPRGAFDVSWHNPPFQEQHKGDWPAWLILNGAAQTLSAHGHTSCAAVEIKKIVIWQVLKEAGQSFLYSSNGKMRLLILWGLHLFSVSLSLIPQGFMSHYNPMTREFHFLYSFIRASLFIYLFAIVQII